MGSWGRIPESPPIFTRNRRAACVLSVDWSWIDSLAAPWRFTVLSGWGVRQGGIHGSFLPANVVPHAFVSFNSWEGAPMRLGFALFQALTLGVPFYPIPFQSGSSNAACVSGFHRHDETLSVVAMHVGNLRRK